MAKSRRSTQENIFVEPDILEEFPAKLPDDDIEDDPIATEEHRVVTKFSRRVPVATLNGSAQPSVTDEPAMAPAITIDEDAPPPHIARFLAEMGASADRWQMVVYRLADYGKDARTDPARRKLCGILDFSEDYEIEIQRRWARPNTSNHFIVLVKKNGHYIKGGTLPVFSCEPAALNDRILAPGEPSSVSALSAPMPMPYVIETNAHEQPPFDPLRQMKQQLEMMKLMRETFGPPPVTAQPAPALDAETSFLQVLARDTSIVDKLAKGTLGKLLGDGAAADRNEWAEVAMETIKSGQAPQIIKSAIDAIFSGFGGLMPRPNDPLPPTINQATAVEIGAPITGANATINQPPQSEEQSPEMQVLDLVLDHCARQIPPQIAAQRIFAIADQINTDAPAFSIDGYLDLFASMDPGAALEMAKTLNPNGERVVALPHARTWTASLQTLMKSQEEGSDEPA